MNMWVLRQKKDQNVHPNFAPNITMEFHYPDVWYMPEFGAEAGGMLQQDSLLRSAELVPIGTLSGSQLIGENVSNFCPLTTTSRHILAMFMALA